MVNPKVLRIYASQNNDIRGWGQSELIRDESLKTIDDPLSASGDQVNKPGSSIPTVFARMKFFQTAFMSIRQINIPQGQSVPVYNRLVSECLDILELIYSHANNIRVECWNRNEQLDKLRTDGHALLANALELHCNNYLHNITDIYLIYQGKELIGGSSPFTIAYTSPNWQRNRNPPVKSLLERNEKFREYMYHFAVAYKSVDNNKDLMSFIQYITICRDNDPQLRLREIADGTVAINGFYEKYPPYNFKINGINRSAQICNAPTIYLNARNTDTIHSDFYIDSELVPFEAAHTPLVLHPGVYPHMRYYDEESWPAGQNVIQVEGMSDDTRARDLPGCTLYRHTFLAAINFLEDKLLRIPYRINESKFKGVIKLSDEVSCLLPLKPMFFKYFRGDRLDTYFSYNVDDTACVVSLTIPVRDNTGTIHHQVTITKAYDLVNDVVRTGNNDFDVSFNIGFFPFYKCVVNPELNKFIVLSQVENQDVEWDVNLQFFKYGNRVPLTPGMDKERNRQPTSKFYQVKDFDYVQVHYNPIVKGILLPNFEKKENNGASQYYYAIDFGTTNTHIAFISDAVNNARSFQAEHIKDQVVYLCSIKDQTRESCGIDNASLVLQANREFFPIFKDDSYSFPIRTVVGARQALNAKSCLFGDVSIGFHYSKEFITQAFYNTKLKWALEHDNPNQRVLTSIERLFEELLWMVKNHWVLCPDSDNTHYPVIMLTHPLVMTNWSTLFGLWKNAYATVFGITVVQTNEYFKDMTESLAPCQSIVVEVKNAGIASGILNIDVGGGSTDFQYYKVNGGETIAYYDSILFAGDDLWGKGFENLSTNIGAAIETNQFIQFAQRTLNNVEIHVGQETKSIGEINITDPKEFVNILLRDQNGHFKHILSNPKQNVCRKMMSIHYASIIYHIANWMIINPQMSFPMIINFTGLGSKYIEMLFPGNKELTEFTKVLIDAFVAVPVPAGFQVHISDNPKNATAEGAALFAKEGNWPASIVQHHPGFNGNFASVNLGNFPQYQEAVINYFDDFIDRFNARPILGAYDIRLTGAEVNDIKNNARQSLNNVYAIKCQGVQNLNAVNIEESMFFWMLKDSLWKLQ